MNLYVMQIPRKEVESKDIRTITYYQKQLEKIKAPSQCVEVTFSGYDETTEEVFEINEIRSWVTKLLKVVPEFLYYTSLEMGTTIRLLACTYDFSTVSPKRMNAHEANEYAAIHGDFQQQPISISIPANELARLYSAIQSYGNQRKDREGAAEILNTLKSIFGG